MLRGDALAHDPAGDGDELVVHVGDALGVDLFAHLRDELFPTRLSGERLEVSRHSALPSRSGGHGLRRAARLTSWMRFARAAPILRSDALSVPIEHPRQIYRYRNSPARVPHPARSSSPWGVRFDHTGSARRTTLRTTRSSTRLTWGGGVRSPPMYVRSSTERGGPGGGDERNSGALRHGRRQSAAAASTTSARISTRSSRRSGRAPISRRSSAASSDWPRKPRGATPV